MGEERHDSLVEKFAGIAQAAREFMMGEDVDPSLKLVPEYPSRCVICRILSRTSVAGMAATTDVIVEMEENLLLFRNGHARMVERKIGRRVGTGGSSGVGYLDKTLNYRMFRDCGRFRPFLAKDRLPALDQPEFYGFASPD